MITATYASSAEAYVWVGLDVVGPGNAEIGPVDITGGDGSWAWSFDLALSAAGTWTLTFTADEGARAIASCQLAVADTGTSPGLPDPEVCLCGETDDDGSTCETCAMVESAGGACLDPPSPIHPSGSGTWACLDSAGCDGDLCRIWCPGEPCDTVAHPDGCPQGVEACWVDPSITDYEVACRSCCESRHHAPTGEYACWDDTYNMCRYPGDCGTPYP